MPVCLEVHWNLIGGHLVAFYAPTSQVVDHRMVDKYVRENCAKKTDAMNFSHCTHALGLTRVPKKQNAKASHTESEG